MTELRAGSSGQAPSIWARLRLGSVGTVIAAVGLSLCASYFFSSRGGAPSPRGVVGSGPADNAPWRRDLRILQEEIDSLRGSRGRRGSGSSQQEPAAPPDAGVERRAEADGRERVEQTLDRLQARLDAEHSDEPWRAHVGRLLTGLPDAPGVPGLRQLQCGTTLCRVEFAAATRSPNQALREQLASPEGIRTSFITRYLHRTDGLIATEVFLSREGFSITGARE